MASRVTEKRKRGVNLDRLTDREEHYVDQYMIDFNGTRAAREAGYKSPNAASGKLLKKPKIKAEIGKRLRETHEGLLLTRENVLSELALVLFRDPADLIDERGMFHTDIRNIPLRFRRCLDGFKIKQRVHPETGEVTTEMDVKMPSKLEAVKMAMQHLGILTEQHALEIGVNPKLIDHLMDAVEDQQKTMVIDSKMLDEIAEDVDE